MKSLAAAFFVAIAFLSLITAYGLSTSAQTNILNVPSQNYPTIQSALSAAKNGDTIQIAPGVYNENVTCSPYTRVLSNQPQSSSSLYNVTILGPSISEAVIQGSLRLSGFRSLVLSRLKVTGSLTIGGMSFDMMSDSTIVGLTVQGGTVLGGWNNLLYNNTLGQLQILGADSKMTGSSIDNTIKGNTISGGIIFTPTSYSNIIDGNIIIGGDIGIADNQKPSHYYKTGGNTFTGNRISNCRVGISIYSSIASTQHTDESYWHDPDNVTNNIISDNQIGIEFFAPDNTIKPNTITNNELINNNAQVLLHDSMSNIWSSKGIGNYWSDYKGTDANSDGIGDSPYVINLDNIDYYPVIHSTIIPTPNPTPTPAPTPTSSSNPNPTTQPTNTPILSIPPSPTPANTPSMSPSRTPVLETPGHPQSPSPASLDPTPHPTGSTTPAPTDADAQSTATPEKSSPASTPAIPEFTMLVVILAMAVTLGLLLVLSRHRIRTH